MLPAYHFYIVSLANIYNKMIFAKYRILFLANFNIKIVNFISHEFIKYYFYRSFYCEYWTTFPFFYYLCNNFITMPKPQGWKLRMKVFLGKALLDALCLTHRNLAVPNLIVKNQSNNDAHGYVISDKHVADSRHWLSCNLSSYTYRRGLQRCSFNYQGDARASMRGTSDKKIPTLFRINNCN
jgi:hypothetical protein